jgi:PIN domain nuclease of toxin-antitoxin system
VKLLCDTHVLLWAAYQPDRLPATARMSILDPDNTPWFSVVSLWEVAIKRARDRADFQVDAAVLRAGLLANGYAELPVDGRHVLALATLPALHGDPFDRMLVAQAATDGLALLTADRQLAAYGSPVRLV